jgi:glycosyltransferase involved in cell wall biosynthesis
VLDAARDVPVVCTVHDHRLFVSDRPGARWSPGSVASRSLVWFARARVRRHAAAVTAASPELADRLRAAGIASVVVVPPFADPDPDPWRAPSGRDVVYAGRLADGKGVDVLLDGFAAVAAADPDARLRIAGDGPEARALRERASGLRDRVRFDGLLDAEAVGALLRDARVVCVPSVAAEGLPLLLVEAMLAGRAVVASDLPSLRSALADGALGVLVPPGDPAALGATLLGLLRDDARVEALGRAARAAAERRYDTARAVDRFVEVYRGVLGPHG